MDLDVDCQIEKIKGACGVRIRESIVDKHPSEKGWKHYYIRVLALHTPDRLRKRLGVLKEKARWAPSI